MRARLAVLLVVLSTLWGCQGSRERVVVVERIGDEARVEVEGHGQAQTLALPRETVTMADGKHPILRRGQVSPEELRLQFGSLIVALPPKTRQYTVYFATGAPHLTPSGLEQLDAVLADAAGTPLAEVVITGHTDTTGTAADNKVLSQRRADFVAYYLVQHGLKSRHLRVYGVGARQLLVPTADDVAEPWNRRVTIKVR